MALCLQSEAYATALMCACAVTGDGELAQRLCLIHPDACLFPVLFLVPVGVFAPPAFLQLGG